MDRMVIEVAELHRRRLQKAAGGAKVFDPHGLRPDDVLTSSANRARDV
jgi:phosphohistidine phosphatase SixA